MFVLFGHIVYTDFQSINFNSYNFYFLLLFVFYVFAVAFLNIFIMGPLKDLMTEPSSSPLRTFSH